MKTVVTTKRKKLKQTKKKIEVKKYNVQKLKIKREQN